MFVEIVRLFVVFLATAGGFAMGAGGGGPEAGNGAILGATLGASLGYVLGGVVGRLLRRAMGVVDRRIEQAPAHRVFSGAVGGIALGGLTGVIGIPAVLLLPGRAGWPLLGLCIWTGAYQGYSYGSRKSDDLLAMAGLSSRPLVRASPYGDNVEQDAVLVDTSAVIDGCLLPLARAGFLRDALLVPRFVLDELQGIADAQDANRRRRGRRGLEILEALAEQTGVEVHVLDDEVPEHDEVDAKLVALARRLRTSLVTVDEPLQRVAELQGVRCLSVRRLTDGLRPVHVAGDRLQLRISRPGKEPGQGVGFLPDGTMVVVTDAAHLVGQDADVNVSSTVQTSMGRMIFAVVSSSEQSSSDELDGAAGDRRSRTPSAASS
ncbi:MAG TPA: PIN domain-containing protein [Acidimicrobiales bacterium]|nr:PIN domain-containing protein [Acidimicrobiales bacterium]